METVAEVADLQVSQDLLGVRLQRLADQELERTAPKD